MNHIRNELSRLLTECGVDMVIANQVAEHIPVGLAYQFFDQLSESRITYNVLEKETSNLQSSIIDLEREIRYISGTNENLEDRLIDMTRKYKDYKSELENLSKKQSLDTSTHHP